MAIAFSNRGCVHSRKTKVARCRTGNVGMNRTKNMWRHSSRKTDVIEVALTAAVTSEDYKMSCVPIHQFAYSPSSSPSPTHPELLGGFHLTELSQSMNFDRRMNWASRSSLNLYLARPAERVGFPKASATDPKYRKTLCSGKDSQSQAILGQSPALEWRSAALNLDPSEVAPMPAPAQELRELLTRHDSNPMTEVYSLGLVVEP